MKKLIAITFLLGVMASPALAYNMQCGFPPFPPFGCQKENAVCQCYGPGQCQWVFVGCGG